MEIALVVDCCTPFISYPLKMLLLHPELRVETAISKYSKLMALQLENSCCRCCKRMFALIDIMLYFSFRFQWIEMTLYSPMNDSLPICFVGSHRKFNHPPICLLSNEISVDFCWQLVQPNWLEPVLQSDGKSANGIYRIRSNRQHAMHACNGCYFSAQFEFYNRNSKSFDDLNWQCYVRIDQVLEHPAKV